MEEVDDFTQKFLQNAEQRSKKLGISSMSKIPLTESNTKATPFKQNSTKSPNRSASNKLQSTTPASARKVTVRSNSSANEVNTESKENTDLALEINITTGPNVQLQVQVDEQEIDGDGNVLKTIQSQRKEIPSIEQIEDTTNVTPSNHCIRDSSKNQLDRLGALYSNPQGLSSPVHRTESAFTIEQERERRNGNLNRNNRFTKLNELTKFYNECDDEIKTQTNSQENGGNIIDRTDAKASPKQVTKSTEKKMVETNNRNVNSPQKTNTGTITKTVLNRFAPNKTQTETNDNKKSSDKQVVWDKRVMDSLEAQGFKRRDTTNKRLEYNFNYKGKGSPKKDNVVEQKVVSKPPVPPTTPVAAKAEATTVAANKNVDIGKGLVSNRAAVFETSQFTLRGGSTSLAGRNQKDPTELSLKERMALFEKNKGTALIPKAAFGMAPSMKQIQNENNRITEGSKPVVTTPQQPMVGRAPSNVANSPSKINNFNRAVVADTNAGGHGIRHTVAALLNNPATIAESRIANETRKMREEEINVVLNRFNNKAQDVEPASPPPAPPMPESLFSTNSSGRKRLSGERREKHEISPQVKSSLEDVKRVRVNPPKNGHIYPTLSDIESTESERNQYTDDDNNEQPKLDRYLNSSRSDQDDEEAEDSYIDSDSSYQQERRKDERHVHYADSSMTSADSDNDMDKYLDDAFDNSEDDDRRESLGHKKGTVSSNSFSFERKPLNRQTETIFEDEATTSYGAASKLHSPIKSKLTVNPSDDNNTVTLTHTVSFYRRQQTQNASPAVRKANHHKLNFESAAETTDVDTEMDDLKPKNDFNQTEEALAQDKIKTLMNNIIIQQQKIAQASNALNTCASTVEFSGSTESVVAEWSLLVATHCRQAALNEMSRLKVERCLRPADAPKECGRLTVKEITLPLNQEYISKLSTQKIPGHNLVCLLKYNEHVLATKTMPTLPGLLSVKFPDVLQLDNVYADFKVTLEIYGMTAPREFLPHEIKYHINKNGKKGALKTPKKGKKCGSNLIMPPVQSPAGPSAIRSPSFISYGFAIFSLREAQRNSWTLNQMSNVSPLVGTIHMKVNCALSVNIDHRGFLTMFEDISGFGAWHRRWCRLHGNMLSYWKYPDDERKPPIGTLDLNSCQQQKITTAPREICARMNTLLIEMKRPRQADDQDSFRLQVSGDYTIVRHLLSADTKEDQIEWCAHFNKTLALMRAWGNSQR